VDTVLDRHPADLVVRRRQPDRRRRVDRRLELGEVHAAAAGDERRAQQDDAEAHPAIIP
jgi:hypothetical protein